MVSEQTVILADFFLTRPSPQAQAPPRLDAFELLLARAERAPQPGGWRSWLQGLATSAEAQRVSPARLAARAWLAPEVGADTYWFATPVHYLAGIDTVHLHPDGLLALAADEQRALAADFNALFGDDGWRLHGLERRELLLRGPPLVASADDPGPWAGRDPSAGAPTGPDADQLRRLGSEIEMWLHEHPLNLRRRERGQLAVTGLWLWGSLPVPAAQPEGAGHAVPELYGTDLHAEGLWRLAGRAARALPPRFESEAAPMTHRIALVQALGPEGLIQIVQRLEQGWLAPALGAVRAGRLRQLRLIAGERSFRLRRAHLARFWRAPAPWWQALA